METVSIQNATRGERRRAFERMIAGGVGGILLIFAVAMMWFSKAVQMVLGEGVVHTWGATIMVVSAVLGVLCLLFALVVRGVSEVVGDRKIEE